MGEAGPPNHLDNRVDSDQNYLLQVALYLPSYPGGCMYLHTGLRYRGTSLTRKRTSLGPYSSPMPRALW